jgi:N-acetylglucosaminyldiphosphoundecaprenol N-acetyl-beta-D-mannosaminyltransferase
MNIAFDLPRHEILGAMVHALTMNQTLDIVDDAIIAKTRLMIGVVNAAKIMKMRKDPELAADVHGSDLVLADGMSVVYASRLLRKPLPERIAGIDLMHGILERGCAKVYRVYCLGATEAISAVVEERFRDQYPGVQLVGRRHGYFSAEEEQQVVADIASCNADVLFVAMTSPKKERFMAKWGRQLNVTVIHGVGGSFDVVAGHVHRAPESWQNVGMEWLYRVKQEPGRLWWRYLVTNTSFLSALLVEWVRTLYRGPGT